MQSARRNRAVGFVYNGWTPGGAAVGLDNERERRNDRVTNRCVLFGSACIACILFLATPSAGANAPPIADFDVRTGDSNSPNSVVLDATTSYDTDGTITAYQWLFGDGTTGSGATKAHTYPSVSSYTVTLVVTDNQGASHLASRTIDLSQPLAAPTTATSQEAAAAASVPVGTRVGARAPQFALPDLEDSIVRLSDFLGRVVLLEFWSSGCPACVSALPYLESLRRAYQSRGLVVVDVVTNYNYRNAGNLLAQSGYTGFVTLREIDPAAKPTMALYRVVRVPHAFLIDRTGVVRFNGHLSFLREDTIESWL
jgi:thiol-disulfide isomerase/thioredoxin